MRDRLLHAVSVGREALNYEAWPMETKGCKRQVGWQKVLNNMSLFNVFDLKIEAGITLSDEMSCDSGENL